MKSQVNIKKLNENAVIPTYGSEYAAGADLYACTDENIVIMPGETKLIHTGLAMEIPKGYAGLIYARSGLAIKHGLSPANCVGVIDSDYRGEIIVGLHNSSAADYVIKPHERIAQLIVGELPRVTVEECEDLSDTLRAAGGFGSTGRM